MCGRNTNRCGMGVSCILKQEDMNFAILKNEYNDYKTHSEKMRICGTI